MGRAAGHLRVAVAVAAVLWGAEARALNWSLQLNPAWTSASTVATDETGRSTETEFSAVTQRYRLSIDQPLWPLLVFSAGGNLDWILGSQRAGELSSEVDSRTWNGFASLRAGGRLLSGGLDYNRREQLVDVSAGAGATSAPAVVRETYGATLAWNPADLPSLDLQLSRADSYDRERASLNRTAQSAALTLRHSPVKQVDLRGAVTLGQGIDRIADVETRDLAGSLAGSWTDSFLAGRVTTYLNYVAAARRSRVTARGPGGTVPTQQLAAGGLSKVEAIADLPTRVTLNPNAALVDGSTGASAGLNLGFGPTVAGDRASRDLGALFPNVVTPVNAVFVYVDRSLPLSVAGTFAWEAYQSNDNVDWTRIGITGAILFDPLQNRFEIPIERTQARYLKVVTRPLDFGVTTDPQFADIFVTELQFFLLVPAADVQGTSTAFAESANGSVRVVLVRSKNLSYDFSGTTTHAIHPTVYTWSVTNGLSIANRLSPVLAYAARVDRSDSDPGQGHVGQSRWSASLSADPLPTLGGALTYSGQLTEERGGTSLGNSLNLSSHAELYQGISLGAGAGASLAESAAGRISSGANASLSMSLVPNRSLSASGTVSYTYSEQTGGGQAAQSARSGVVEGSAAFNPFPALALAGSVTRVFLGTRPSTLGSFSAAVSPFQGGDLQLRYTYAASFETASDSRTRNHGPTVRWNIRSGWHVEGGAQFGSASTPAQTVETVYYFANLLITLK